MKRRQIPSGYVSSFSSHTDPAIAPPPPPIAEQKQAQTLMGHCLKEFIKERLYGNIVNYTRNNNQKYVKITPMQSSLQEDSMIKQRSSTSMRVEQQRKLGEARQNIEKRMHGRYDSIIKNTRNKLEQQRGGYRYSLGNIQSSLIDNVRPKRNRSPLTHKYSPHQQTQRSFEQGERYKCSSFISAIEEEDGRESKIKKQQKKLMPLTKNSLMGRDKQDRAKAVSKSPTSPSRLEKEKFVISPQFWQLVCKKSKKSDNEFDNSLASALAKDNSSTLIENKSLGSAGLSSLLGKSGSQLPTLNPIDKSKYFLSKAVFSRELFLEYLSNSKYVVKRLAQFLFNFFQMSGKTYDQMKPEDYKQLMEVITTAGPRVWAVCAFRFWDVDKNGIICSSDIFKIFKDLDKLKTELMENNVVYQDLNGYKIIDSLLKTVDKLRSLTLEQRLDEQMKSVQKNMAKDGQFEIKYLEESVLKRKQLKYSDLALILGHNFKITTKQAKKSVIETTKQLSIKMSSCYRYSFLATDHNEQTREDRQQIQTLKQSLRKQKMDLVELTNEEELINKKLPGIKYTTFVEKQIYKSFKQLTYLIFGIQSI